MRITAILLFIVTFLYIYNIKFVFIPGPLRSRMIIGIIAFFAFFMLGKTAWRVCGKVIMMSAVFCLLNVLSCFGSQTNDYWFVQFSVLTILYCFGGYWIGYLIKEKLHFSVYQFLSLFVIIVSVHNLIAFAGFVFPPIANFIGSVLLGEETKNIVVTVFADDNKKYLSTELFKPIDEDKEFISNKIELISYENI